MQSLARDPRVRKICELGGGSVPCLPLALVEKEGIEYTILDISAEELAKAPAGYRKIR